MEVIEIMDIAGYPAIVAICFVLGLVIKALALGDKWIPVSLGIAGAALGVVGFFLIPGFPADNVLAALAVGAVSGLSSTGVHQVWKQQKKEDT